MTVAVALALGLREHIRRRITDLISGSLGKLGHAFIGVKALSELQVFVSGDLSASLSSAECCQGKRGEEFQVHHCCVSFLVVKVVYFNDYNLP